nr:MAG TPA: hypothetical protein [Bacteriophage sp.]
MKMEEKINFILLGKGLLIYKIGLKMQQIL